MKKLYKFQFDCGRMGVLEGLFIEDSQIIDDLVKSGALIYFGEVLGKHSDVVCEMHSDYIDVLSDDQNLIEKLLVAVKSNTISGYNPVDYISEVE